MRVVVQRSLQAKVEVNGETAGKIESGLMSAVGVTHDDTEEDAQYLAEKIVNLRIFEDENEKMNLSVKDKEGQILSISQFTLYGDCRKGRRPNFMVTRNQIKRRSFMISLMKNSGNTEVMWRLEDSAR